MPVLYERDLQRKEVHVHLIFVLRDLWCSLYWVLFLRWDCIKPAVGSVLEPIFSFLFCADCTLRDTNAMCLNCSTGHVFRCNTGHLCGLCLSWLCLYWPTENGCLTSQHHWVDLGLFAGHYDPFCVALRHGKCRCALFSRSVVGVLCWLNWGWVCSSFLVGFFITS